MGRNGGIGGSGIFGLIGTTVQCKSDDSSPYCTAAKVINVIMWLAILYLIFLFIRNKK